MDIRTTFHKSLREIQCEMLNMGSMVSQAINLSVTALKNRDLSLAQQIIDDDKKINEKRHQVEEGCIQLMATQQPMASDLRTLVSLIGIVYELERIGDYAEGIAKITEMIGNEPPLKPLVDIPRMAEKTVGMLNRSLEAFISRDAEAAKQISAEDNEVDDLYSQVFRELISYMVEDPRTITRATRLIWVAHNLERSSDRVTNICERIVFVVTGQMIEIGASKY